MTVSAGLGSPRALGKDPSRLVQILGVLASLACGSIAPVSASVVPRCLPVSLSLCLSYKDTSHIGLGSILLQYGFILTNYTCKTPISK